MTAMGVLAIAAHTHTSTSGWILAVVSIAVALIAATAALVTARTARETAREAELAAKLSMRASLEMKKTEGNEFEALQQAVEQVGEHDKPSKAGSASRLRDKFWG
jgi:flagellar biosynthesis/type III secretory pathway M-ring protein FliF/YscJ